MGKNDTCWQQTAIQSQLNLVADMFDDLREDHHALIKGIKAAIVMLKEGDDVNTGIQMLEMELEMRRCD